MGVITKPIKNAMDILLRDMNKVFVGQNTLNKDEKTEVIIRWSSDDKEPLLKSENFTLKFQSIDNKSVMNIKAVMKTPGNQFSKLY